MFPAPTHPGDALHGTVSRWWMSGGGGKKGKSGGERKKKAKKAKKAKKKQKGREEGQNPLQALGRNKAVRGSRVPRINS